MTHQCSHHSHHPVRCNLLGLGAVDPGMDPKTARRHKSLHLSCKCLVFVSLWVLCNKSSSRRSGKHYKHRLHQLCDRSHCRVCHRSPFEEGPVPGRTLTTCDRSGKFEYLPCRSRVLLCLQGHRSNFEWCQGYILYRSRRLCDHSHCLCRRRSPGQEGPVLCTSPIALLRDRSGRLPYRSHVLLCLQGHRSNFGSLWGYRQRRHYLRRFGRHSRCLVCHRPLSKG